VNPLTGIKELLINEDMITLALIHKTKLEESAQIY